MARRWMRSAATVAGLGLLVTGCAGSADPVGGNEDPTATSGPVEPPGDPIIVGIVTATSGPVGIYGAAWLEGLHAGIDYATGGTGAVHGRPLQLEIIDDAGDPERAITAATDLVGRGVTIVAGTLASGVAIQMAPFAEENDILYIVGAAAADVITGINRHTFRAGRQTYQDVATVADLLDSVDDAQVLVFAQDGAFGEGNVAAVDAVIGGMGANVSSLLVPPTVTEFTPFAQRINDADPDLLFVAWAGETTSAMWRALQQQGVFDTTTVTTGLGDVGSYSAYSQDPSGIEFISHFIPGTLDNPVHNAMAERIDQVDIFTPDGFVTAMMIVRALEEAGPDDVTGMIEALEGWSFDAPKGPQQIRASDHAMIQPMFIGTLEAGDDGGFRARLLGTVAPEAVAPPEL